MAEFLKVRYDRNRKVCIDGEVSGLTNTKLRVSRGPHVITLGEPVNYEPSEHEPNVTGTSVGRPMEVLFTRISDED